MTTSSSAPAIEFAGVRKDYLSHGETVPQRIRIHRGHIGKPAGETAGPVGLPGLVAGHSPFGEGPPNRHDFRLLATVAGELLGRNEPGLIGDGRIAVIGAAGSRGACNHNGQDHATHGKPHGI